VALSARWPPWHRRLRADPPDQLVPPDPPGQLDPGLLWLRLDRSCLADQQVRYFPVGPEDPP